MTDGRGDRRHGAQLEPGPPLRRRQGVVESVAAIMTSLQAALWTSTARSTSS